MKLIDFARRAWWFILIVDLRDQDKKNLSDLCASNVVGERINGAKPTIIENYQGRY